MKREDIDKRIGMPDVDAEWAKFEREVIGKETKRKSWRISAWAGGIGIAATIALLFMLNMSKEEMAEQPLMTQELSKSPLSNRPDENNVSMRLAGNNPHEDDSVLVIIDGNPILLTVSWFAEKTVEEIGRGLQVDIDDIMIRHQDEGCSKHLRHKGIQRACQCCDRRSLAGKHRWTGFERQTNTFRFI